VSVALRTNPDVDAHTHAHITTGTAEVKFGLDIETVKHTLSEPERYPGARLDGLHLHIGSQIIETEPYVLALQRVVPMMKELRSEAVPLSHLDIGGGFGINYRGTEAQPAEAFAKAIAPLVKESGAKLVLEPGRFIVGNAGVLLARVTYVKRTPKRRFVIVDAAMNDLIRPALYGSVHAIWPVKAFGPPPARGGEPDPTSKLTPADVVGPICESGDFLGKDVELPEVERGDLIAVFSAGAYGFTMSSNYNSRPRSAEVMVDGDAATAVRRRETYEDLVRGEE
jgi:diaminopimelate decarboxylase